MHQTGPACPQGQVWWMFPMDHIWLHSQGELVRPSSIQPPRNSLVLTGSLPGGMLWGKRMIGKSPGQSHGKCNHMSPVRSPESPAKGLPGKESFDLQPVPQNMAPFIIKAVKNFLLPYLSPVPLKPWKYQKPQFKKKKKENGRKVRKQSKEWKTKNHQPFQTFQLQKAQIR